MNVVVIGLSHHTSPVELRERFALSPGQIPAVLGQMRTAGIASEGVILSTCNRVE
ncbi:MAG: glutamyl-tRNA reductase, partial [Limisphaerales bacterium]